jgi:hypothetical protein
MHDASVAILVGVAGYVFASVANSTFISQSTNWVFLASLAALASNLEHARWSVEPESRRGLRRLYRSRDREILGEENPSPAVRRARRRYRSYR